MAYRILLTIPVIAVFAIFFKIKIDKDSQKKKNLLKSYFRLIR